MKYLLLAFYLIFSIACKEKIIVESATSEMIFEELIGTWDVKEELTRFIDEVVDSESGIQDYVLVISDDNKISISLSSNEIEIIKDIFVGEELDQIIIISPPDSFMIGEYTTNSIDFFNVKTKEENFQIWEAIKNLQNVEGEDVKIVTKWTMTKR